MISALIIWYHALPIIGSTDGRHYFFLNETHHLKKEKITDLNHVAFGVKPKYFKGVWQMHESLRNAVVDLLYELIVNTRNVDGKGEEERRSKCVDVIPLF